MAACHTADEYTKQLVALLPVGAAWPRDADSTLVRFLSAWAEEFARADGRLCDLLEEADPRTAVELIADWERVYALPECGRFSENLDQRRKVLHAKVTAKGGQSPDYFIQLAARLGYQITVEEYRPFTAGSVAGDLLTNGWEHAWLVRVDSAAGSVSEFRAGSGRAGERLRVFATEPLECAIKQYAPAGTVVRFVYGEEQ